MTDLVSYQQYQEIVSYGRSQEVMETFSRLVGRNAPYYVQSAIIAVQSNDRLMQCTPRSILLDEMIDEINRLEKEKEYLYKRDQMAISNMRKEMVGQ